MMATYKILMVMLRQGPIEMNDPELASFFEVSLSTLRKAVDWAVDGGEIRKTMLHSRGPARYELI